MAGCPVCREEVSDLNQHLEVHTKHEVVLALLKQNVVNSLQPATHSFPSRDSGSGSDPQPGPSGAAPVPTSSGAGQIHIQRTLNNFSIVNNINNPTVVPATPPGNPKPNNMPQVMMPPVVGNTMMCPGGMFPMHIMSSMAGTPFLLPQVNGPTLIINVPNYVSYQGLPQVQGIVVPGPFDQQQQQALPSEILASSNPSSSSLPPSSHSNPVPSPPTLSPVPSTSAPLLPAPLTTTTTATATMSGPLLATTTSSGSSLSRVSSPPLAASTPMQQAHHMSTDSIEVDDPAEMIHEEDETDGCSVVSLHDLSDHRPESASPVPGPSNSSRSRFDTDRLFNSGVHKSVISQNEYCSTSKAYNKVSAIKSSRVGPAQTSDLEANRDCWEESVLSSSQPRIETNGDTTSSSCCKPSVIVSPNNTMSDQSETVVTSTASSSEPTTINTVEALQSALECDNDVQVMVSNDLLETPEFRALMQNMEHSAIIGQPTVMSSTSSSPGLTSREGDDRTPSPPIYLMGGLSSTEPSNDPSRETTKDGFGSENLLASLHPSDEDDLTLQDLIAVETIDESQMAEDDDVPWSEYLPSPSLSDKQEHAFRCERCGLYFPSTADFMVHTSVCSCSSGIKGLPDIGSVKAVKSKPSSKKSFIGLLPSSAATATSSSITAMASCVEDPSINLKIEMADSELRMDQADAKMLVKSECRVGSQDPLGAKASKHWKCGQCKAVFDTGPGLLKHLEAFRSAKIKCYVCHATFMDMSALTEHSQSVHKQDPARIKEDSKLDVKKEEQDRKVFVPNDIGEYVCDMCDRAFKDRDMLQKHLACHFETKPFECLECGKRFAKEKLLKEHIRRHTGVKNFACMYCPKSFMASNKLREHVRTHTGEAPLKCNICGKGFKRHSNLSEHRKLHDPLLTKEVKPPKEIFCQDCGKMFTCKRDLDWHIEETHDRKPKKCKWCGDVFVHSTSLTSHIRQKHQADFIPPDKKASNYANCPVCQQVFYKTSINKHIRVVHQGEKSYPCEICKKVFVSKHNLDNHMWLHKNRRLRPHKCNICNKAYLREGLLKQHMQTHQGLKPYVCNECGAQFTMRSNYKRHVDEHSGARNYVCQECNKTFTRSYYLTDHMKVHSGEKPYICGICGKTAATRSNYNSHLKTHVTREPVNSEV